MRAVSSGRFTIDGQHYKASVYLCKQYIVAHAGISNRLGRSLEESSSNSPEKKAPQQVASVGKY